MKSEPKTKPSSLAKTEPASSDDVAVICGLSPDGQGVSILRKRGERIEAGTIRNLEPGKPIHGDVVKLTPRPDTPLICDVEVEMAAPATTRSSQGPALVASDQYRKNWDAIYKHSSAVSTTQPRSKSKPLLN